MGKFGTEHFIFIMRKWEVETFPTITCPCLGTPKNTALILRLFSSFLAFINTSHHSLVWHSLGTLPRMGGASPQKQRVPVGPAGTPLTPTNQEIGAVPKVGVPIPSAQSYSVTALRVPPGSCVRWRIEKAVEGVEFQEIDCSFLSWPEVFCQWSVLWMPRSRHEPYGQQYPGQGPASGQPPYAGHQPGLYPQQPVSWRAGVSLCFLFKTPTCTVLLLKSFRKHNKND